MAVAVKLLRRAAVNDSTVLSTECYSVLRTMAVKEDAVVVVFVSDASLQCPTTVWIECSRISPWNIPLTLQKKSGCVH